MHPLVLTNIVRIKQECLIDPVDMNRVIRYSLADVADQLIKRDAVLVRRNEYVEGRGTTVRTTIVVLAGEEAKAYIDKTRGSLGDWWDKE